MVSIHKAHTMPGLIALFLIAALLLPVSAVQANPRCAAQLRAEQLRIEREFARDRPEKTDKAATERWAANMHAALQAAGKQAESCQRASAPPVTQGQSKALDNCQAASHAKADEIRRKYANRGSSREEQARERAELEQLQDQRIACDRAVRK